VLLPLEASEKMEALKHYFGIAHNNELIARGIKIRRHDAPNFIMQFQTELLYTLFDCKDMAEVMSKGYENALLIVTKTIDRIMTGEIQLRDLVISKSLQSPYTYTDLQVQASPTHQLFRMLKTTLPYLLLTEM
jgi:DNA polymerase elongation subunit (family B)